VIMEEMTTLQQARTVLALHSPLKTARKCIPGVMLNGALSTILDMSATAYKTWMRLTLMLKGSRHGRRICSFFLVLNLSMADLMTMSGAAV